ncbi:MAG: cdc9 [Labilithrix sp.]|nr:cdc9 [Labilithrix sp.]
MGTPVRRVELFFQEGTSDKVYHATLVDDGDGKFSVLVEWGRRGAPLSKGSKAVKVPREKAERELAKIVSEKTKKGYQEITAEVTPASVAPPVGLGSGSRVATTGRKRTGQAAQLLNAVEEDALERLFDDPIYLAQQKLDGARILAHVGETVIVTNRSGHHSSAPASLLEVLAGAPRGTVLDGELVTADGAVVYWVFDLLRHGTADLRAKPYLDRYQELDALVEELRDPVRLVPAAANAKDKRALFEKLSAARAEGIVFKRRDAPYTPGRPASGGTQLKYKFVKTCDVVVTANAGNAYQMAVWDQERLREVGKVFAGTTNATRKQIDELLASGEQPVAVVEYLYATDDDILFQPVFVQLRDDKEAADCTLAQLIRTNRAARA